MIPISIQTKERNEFIAITDLVQDVCSDMGSGIVTIFVPHTTAGITINENADPDVKRDMLWKLGQLSPDHAEYQHAEGNSDSHVKASLMGSSVTVIVEKGVLVLGTWQGIYFCEFDGPKMRKIYIKKIKD
ncbi:MAG: secondary thiamine-phosphate synthase enzyme YjbQ [Candidatus Woesearchaeota archaeon]